MKRMQLILYSLSLISLLILSSCGVDLSTNNKGVSSNTLLANECELNSEYMPVCGTDLNGKKVDYENISLAKCYKATNVIQGKCECSKPSERLVCMSNEESLKECAAQAAIKNDNSLTIVKFQACN